jgi:hypothetical protein
MFSNFFYTIKNQILSFEGISTSLPVYFLDKKSLKSLKITRK